MAKMKIFTKPDCPKCPAAKVLGAELADSGVEVEYYDISEVNGLAEAQMYMIKSTPSLVVVNDEDDEISSWLGEVPAVVEIQAAMENASQD